MIFGIGADVVEIARIDAALARHGDRFAQRILGPDELARFAARRQRIARRGLAFLATRFAGKEAVSKALGLGLRSPMTWHAVEILNAPGGRPLVRLHGALDDFARARRLRLHISVADERDYAVAYALAEIEAAADDAA
ncbi:MAG TPA: holo-ACP synthase [Burkholderiaceae bacterium]|nr:holo-ACP synthase [Burkholderiaceae bacterium]